MEDDPRTTPDIPKWAKIFGSIVVSVLGLAIVGLLLVLIVAALLWAIGLVI